MTNKINQRVNGQTTSDDLHPHRLPADHFSCEEKKMNTCSYCCELTDSELIDDNGSTLCDNCFFEIFAVCDDCGGVTPDRDIQIFGCRWCNAKRDGLYLNGSTGELEHMIDEDHVYIMDNLGQFENDKDAQKAVESMKIEVHGTYWPIESV